MASEILQHIVVTAAYSNALFQATSAYLCRQFSMIRTISRLALVASLMSALAAQAQMRCNELPVMLIVQD